MQRTEAQKLSRQPIMVTLGGVEYPIHPKPLIHSRLWKEKARSTVDEFEALFKVDFSDTAAAIEAIKRFFFETFDDLVDLVFEWEPEIPKDEVMASATEEEMFEAIQAVLTLAFPLARTLGINATSLTKAMLSTSTQSSPSS